MPVVLSASKSGNTSPSSSPGIFSVTVEVSRLFSGCEERREEAETFSVNGLLHLHTHPLWQYIMDQLRWRVDWRNRPP